MFLVGDRRPGPGIAAVGVGDRFPLHPDLFVGDRDPHRLLFGENIFPGPGVAWRMSTPGDAVFVMLLFEALTVPDGRCWVVGQGCD